MIASADIGTLIYDGDCGFCSATVKWLKDNGGNFDSLPWQKIPDLKSVGLTLQMVTTSAVFISDSGVISLGSSAIGEAMKSCSKPVSCLGKAVTSRLFESLAQRGYKLIAKNRGRLSRATRSCTPQ